MIERINITDQCYFIKTMIEGNAIDLIINYEDNFIQITSINGKPIGIDKMIFDKNISDSIFNRTKRYIEKNIGKIRQYTKD